MSSSELTFPWEYGIPNFMAALIEPLSLGDGLVLTLASSPPPPALFKILMVVEGRGRWSRGSQERALEPSSPWWAGRGPSDQVWEDDGSTRWLCVAGDRCPVPEFGTDFHRLTGLEEPRCCASVVADAPGAVVHRHRMPVPLRAQEPAGSGQKPDADL